RMALAGGDHVHFARRAELHRLAGMIGGKRRRSCDPGGVALLAAETAAETSHRRGDPVVVAAQQPRADMLHLGGMLSRAVHGDVAILTRQRKGNLAFEIEVLLPS